MAIVTPLVVSLFLLIPLLLYLQYFFWRWAGIIMHAEFKICENHVMRRNSVLHKTISFKITESRTLELNKKRDALLMSRILYLKRCPMKMAFIVLLLMTAVVPNAQADLIVSSASTDSVLRYDESTGSFIDVFVPSGSGGLNAPTGLVFGPDGNLYVSSSFTNQVLRYNGATGAFLDTFATFVGVGLAQPSGLVFGPDGNLYVGFASGSSIQRFNGTTGAFIDVFVPQGTADLVFGPDGNLYVTGDSSILRYNGTTGAFIDVFVPFGSGGLNGPQGLVFGPDGHLYVSSLNSFEVLRYNGTTGAFIDVFVPAGSGGLAGPRGLIFGPDGNLYVTSAFNDQILRYDGTTGAFIDSFVPPGSGGLDQPFFLIFDGAQCVITAEIDIRPGNFSNNVNPNSNALIPVAILSTNSFDASTIDQSSIRFGPNQAVAEGSAHFRDVDHDGFLDLILRFRVQEAGIQCGDTLVSITGQTVDGIPIQGSDSITTVGCKAKTGKKK